MFSLSPNKRSSEITTFDTTTEKENLNSISKFRLLTSVVQYINLCLIFYDIHIDDLIIALDIELNSCVFNYLESYQLSPGLIVKLILEVFCEMFYR